MRTDDGEEIVEPGDYELTDGRKLRVYLTQDADETMHMWACTHCQEVDGTTNALLVGIIDGQFNIRQDEDGEFRLSLTDAGKDAARSLIQNLTEEDGDR